MDANKNTIIDEKTKYLNFLLPHADNCLSDDVGRIIQSLGMIDRELYKTMQANVLLSDNGLNLYNLLMSVLATEAKNTNRLNRLELEFIKFAGGGSSGNTEEGNSGYYEEDGTYIGPIAVGNDAMSLTKAGVMLLFDEQVDTQ